MALHKHTLAYLCIHTHKHLPSLLPTGWSEPISARWPPSHFTCFFSPSFQVCFYCTCTGIDVADLRGTLTSNNVPLCGSSIQLGLNHWQPPLYVKLNSYTMWQSTALCRPRFTVKLPFPNIDIPNSHARFLPPCHGQRDRTRWGLVTLIDEMNASRIMVLPHMCSGAP